MYPSKMREVFYKFVFKIYIVTYARIANSNMYFIHTCINAMIFKLYSTVFYIFILCKGLAFDEHIT